MPDAPIPMVDLAAQHAALGPELRRAFERVLASNRFILGGAGGEVAAFEAEVAQALGVPFAVGLSSGSDALLVALAACGVGPGDEVVTTPFTFFATTEAIVRLGARPVFADVDPTTMNLDAAAAAARVGPRTKAVMVVHLFGRVAETKGLAEACAARDIPLLEDAAQAFGAVAPDGRPAGAIGAAAALSFFPSKNLGGFGDGGMLLTVDGELAARARRARTHGATRRFVHETIGGNFRMDELQAALLRVKLPHAATWARRRHDVAQRYREAWAALPVGLPPPDPGSAWNQFVIRVPDGRRDALAAHLAKQGIETAVFYPVPMHLQPALACLGGRPGDLPNAERAAAEVLAVPIHPDLAIADQARICEAVLGAFRDGMR
jgi:dTDP-4-amino-4,6-dideoxygalactose transaminase